MQRAQAEVGSTVSFVMEFKKFDGVRGYQLQVETPPQAEQEKGKGAGKNKGNYVPRPGDWSCMKCKAWNFARNAECRNCRALNPRTESIPVSTGAAPAGSTLASQLWEHRAAPIPKSAATHTAPGVIQSGFKARER